MMEEISGLNLEAVDALIESVGRRDGIVANGYFESDCGCCTLGSLGYDEQDQYDKDYHMEKLFSLDLGGPVSLMLLGMTYKVLAPTREGLQISDESERFKGTPHERKEYMLGFLREQRDLKCSDWVPAPKEWVPKKCRAAVAGL